MSSEGKEALQGRMKLMLSVPELHAALLLQLNDTLKLFAAIVSERTGHPENDFEVLTFSGAVLGAVMSVQLYCLEHDDANFFDKIDEALAQLDTGLLLGK
ncbi:hypothetical protein M3194_19760 [Paenibacillus glycanilyticus]|nr:hypothetical protein [Paenibacillus glycanilyticus]